MLAEKLQNEAYGGPAGSGANNMGGMGGMGGMGAGGLGGAMGGGGVDVNDISDTVPMTEETLVGASPAIGRGRDPFAGLIRPIGGERSGGLHNSNFPQNPISSSNQNPSRPKR